MNATSRAYITSLPDSREPDTVVAKIGTGDMDFSCFSKQALEQAGIPIEKDSQFWFAYVPVCKAEGNKVPQPQGVLKDYPLTFMSFAPFDDT